MDTDRAQRWHDTDHGTERGKPLRPNRFRIPRNEPEPGQVPVCWCCCEWCDPAWGGRPNPFWSRAMAQIPAG